MTNGAMATAHDAHPAARAPPAPGKTFGEVPREDKDKVSHRGKAFACLRAFLTGLAC